MSKLDRVVYDSYMKLDNGSNIQAEYVWIGGSGSDLRCKTRTLK
jgi:glutamine synthetase